MKPESPGPITELEAKFIIPNKATFKKLKRLTKVADATLHGKHTNRVRDVYYDTTDRRLFAAGQTLRYRKTGPRAEACLKGLGGVQGGIHQRQELCVAMPGRFRRKAWLETPVYAKTQRIIGAGNLHKLFVIRQTRTVFSIRRGGVDVALLSLDRVRWAAAGRKQAWFELEIEQTEAGSPDDVAEMADWFQAEWGLLPQPVSKFGRGLDFLDALPAKAAAPPPTEATSALSTASPPEPEPPDLQADDSMAEAARKILRYQLDRMQCFEPVVFQDDDIEGVHQMRVATRKMRAALRLFKPYLPTEFRTAVSKGLHRTARTLGAVRDLDVFWDNLQRELAGGRAKLHPDDLLPLEEIWRAERNRQVQALHHYLRSKAYRRFTKEFAAMLAKGLPARPTPPSPDRLRHTAPVLLYSQLARIHAYDGLISGGTISTPQLHALRIEFKRLRYALDFFDPLLSERNAALIKVCKQIQTHLGDLNDAEVAIKHLRTVLRRGSWQKPTHRPAFPSRIVVASGVQLYLDRQVARKAHLKTGFPRMWQRTQSKKFKQLFANNLKTL